MYPQHNHDSAQKHPDLRITPICASPLANAEIPGLRHSGGSARVLPGLLHHSA
jgi:hypothetical protein